MTYNLLSIIIFIFLCSNNAIKFKITMMSRCAPRDLIFRRILGISLTDCVKECKRRSGCAAVNYYRKRYSCHLLSSESTFNRIVPSCVYIGKQDIEGDVCACPGSIVCDDIFGGGYPTCYAEECKMLQIDHGVIQGNLNTVGSITQYRCEAPYQAATPATVACLETGQWSQIPSCTMDCGEPDDAINAVLVTGPKMVDSVRTYMCNDGYVSPFNQKVNSIDVTCLHSGVWSMVNVQCVAGNQVGYSCNVDTDCANTMSTCIENKCFCDVLYDYSSSLNDCTRVCDYLADDFTVLPDTYIVQYNGHRVYNISAEECTDVCRMNDTCYYFEDRHDGCIFGHVTVAMLYDADPDAVDHSENGYTVFSRTCVPIYTSGPSVLVMISLFDACTNHSIDHPVLIKDIREPVHDRSQSYPETTVLTCASPFITNTGSLMDVVDNGDTSSRRLRMVVNQMIDVLCGFNYEISIKFIACIQLYLPQSTHISDRLINKTFNISRLLYILYGGCNVTSDLRKSMECIVNDAMSNPPTAQCMADVGHFFFKTPNTTISHNLNDLVKELCRLEGHVPPADSVLDQVFSVFTSNNSAMHHCASIYIRDNSSFIPTLIIDPAGFTTDTLVRISSLCGRQIEGFLYCMDERRLNSSSTSDTFLFKIFNTVNLRMAYHALCSNIEVLRTHANCFVNTRLELETCMCYMTDLMDKIVELTSSPEGFTFDQLIDPYCSSYISFLDCFIGLLSTCSHDLGHVMENVYLGALTPSCLGAGTVSCGPMMLEQNTTLYSSAIFQCGESVAGFISHVTKETNITMEIDEMMTKMEDLILGGYSYICSIGDDILNCLQTNMTASGHELDKLVTQMFNMSKLGYILKKGCDDSLIQDVETSLRYILSLILSDPRSSDCIEALEMFKFVQTGEIRRQYSQDPYCRIWSDFSGCIESKLSCSSQKLAKVWRHFTLESLSKDCYITALHQQEVSVLNSQCKKDGMVDSALSLCGMSFMASHVAHKQEVTSQQLDDLIKDDINYFCIRNMDNALTMIDCLISTLPVSEMKIDKIVSTVFNISVLEETATTICSQSKAIKDRLRCIINSLEASKYLSTCLQYLNVGFDVTMYKYKTMEELKHLACSGWQRLSSCILPHINTCDIELSKVWTDLTHHVLSPDCQGFIAQTARLNAKSRCSALVFSVLLNILLVLISILCSIFVSTESDF